MDAKVKAEKAIVRAAMKWWYSRNAYRKRGETPVYREMLNRACYRLAGLKK